VVRARVDTFHRISPLRARHYRTLHYNITPPPRLLNPFPLANLRVSIRHMHAHLALNNIISFVIYLPTYCTSRMAFFSFFQHVLMLIKMQRPCVDVHARVIFMTFVFFAPKRPRTISVLTCLLCRFISFYQSRVSRHGLIRLPTQRLILPLTWWEGDVRQVRKYNMNNMPMTL
jgi:hypothetical protein